MFSCKNLLQLTVRATVVSLFITTAISAQAASVWKISSDKHSLYIGGTIHILAPEDYPLPQEYERAFAAASKLVFETDMAAVKTLEFQQMMMAKMSYSDGTTIDKILDAKIYSALSAHLASRQIPMAAVATMKANLLAITLSIVELQKMGFTSIGVDQFYTDRANEKGKAVAWLESPEQQINFIANMGNGDANEMIEYALKDIKKMPETIGQLRRTWLSGDMEGMAAVGIAPFKADYPQIYQDLLVTRNNNWLPQIETMLKDKPVELILVGALHLAGPDSVLHSLAAKGYKVEQL